MMTRFIHYFYLLNNFNSQKKIIADSSLKLSIFSQSPRKLTAVKLKLIFNSGGRHVPCLSAIDKHKIKNTHQPYSIPLPKHSMYNILDSFLCVLIHIIDTAHEIVGCVLFQSSTERKFNNVFNYMSLHGSHLKYSKTGDEGDNLVSIHSPNKISLTRLSLIKDVPFVMIW